MELVNIEELIKINCELVGLSQLFFIQEFIIRLIIFWFIAQYLNWSVNACVCVCVCVCVCIYVCVCV